MIYWVKIEIDKTVEEVIRLFDNTENLYKWMPGLVSFEHIEAVPGEPGARSKMRFKNLPEGFTGAYKADSVFNIVKNSFKELPGSRTEYSAEQEFRFRGFMKIMGFLI